MMKALSVLVSLVLFAGLTSASAVAAEEVRMSSGESLPPHVLADIDAGIEVDIAREALANSGYTLVPVYVPPRRIAYELLNGFVDAAAKDQGTPISEDGFFYADETFFFHDMGFTLEDAALDPTSPEDMAALRIVAFQNAVLHYPRWLLTAQEEGRYSEIVDQSLQVQMLQRGHTDVIVADISIVSYHMQRLEASSGAALKPIVPHLIGDKISYAPIFRSEKLRDDFNSGLAHLRQTGRYDEIIAQYTE